MTLPLSLNGRSSTSFQSAPNWTAAETRVWWFRPLERAFARHPIFTFAAAALLTGFGMVAAVAGLVLVLVCPAVLLAGIL